MFSEAVDVVGSRSGQIDVRSRANQIGYVNLTIAELSTKFPLYRDRLEMSIDVSSVDENSYTWERPALLRKMEAVRYSVPCVAYPRLLGPGPAQSGGDDDLYYYGTNLYFVFNGISDFGSIDVSYFVKHPRFAYYEEGTRPAVYDVPSRMWTYLLNDEYVVTLGNQTNEEIARDTVADWILIDYYDTVIEGALAKYLKTIEDKRAPSTFAVYKTMQEIFFSAESVEGVYNRAD